MSGRRRIVVLAIVAVALGIFARLDSLDRKVLWFDESFSLLRISGHSERALYALFDGRVHASDELLALQTVTPERGLRATFRSLDEEPQRGPLYYALARLWIGRAGDATAAVRGLSVVLGIAGIGLGFLLGRRLTASLEGGCILAALIALSPIAIRFSQQVREYVLVADLTLLSALLLLRAFEKPSALRWTAYALCSLAGLFTNVTFAFLIVAEGLVALALALRKRERAAGLARGYVIAGAAAVAIYAPWGLAAARSASGHTVDLSWAAAVYPLRSTLVKWAFNVGAVFFDSEYAHRAWGVALVPLLAVVALALRNALTRRGPAAPRQLALAVTFCTLVPMVALDTLRHAHYELVARYQMTTWLGIAMLVTLLVAPGLQAATVRARALAGCALGLVLAAGVTSVFADRGYSEWWDNNDHLSESAVAGVIRAGAQPALVVASAARDDAYDTFVLSRYLPPGTAMLLFDERLPALPLGYAVTYFFTPTRADLAAVAERTGVLPQNVSPSPGLAVPELNPTRNVNAETVVANNALWRLVVDGALGARK